LGVFSFSLELCVGRKQALQVKWPFINNQKTAVALLRLRQPVDVVAEAAKLHHQIAA
jgi:hypothetical protein